MQKKILSSLAMLLTAWPFLFAQQKIVDSFPQAKAAMIMNVLAGDSLRGRGNLTTDLIKAGRFIMNEFSGAGLQPLPGSAVFFDAFQSNGGPSVKKRDQLLWNESKIARKDFLYLPAEPGGYAPLSLADFRIIQVDSFKKNLLDQYNDVPENILFWSRSRVKNWSFLRVPAKGIKASRLFVHTLTPPQTLQLRCNGSYFRSVEYNLIGVLPGKTSPGECIVFSSHYDHEGVISKGNDTIMNGANDNASGTAALLMLAKYYSMRNDNDRTLIFCAFAGEELGLQGSFALSKKLDASRLKAGINLEMLGVPQYGTGRVFITGQRYSSLPELLSTQLRHFGLEVIDEPSEDKRLFGRSDNYPFVIKGVPFHTVMASDDDEPCYHRPCDEISRINIDNLCFITRAIAHASALLVNGKENPGRATLPDWD